MNNLGNKEIFSQNLKRYMEENKRTRNDIEAKLKVPYTTVCDWVNGNTYPRIDKIEMLADYFNIEKSDLIEERKEGNLDQDIKIISRDMKVMTDEQRATLIRVARTLFNEGLDDV